MIENGKVNVLLVDDQPGKLMSYEVMLAELGENIIKTSSAKEALAVLLKTDVAVILVDVCMPELDGFELAALIRDHPRFQRTAIIFISAIHISESDSLRGYDAGAVDYVPVPVVPEVLRAKVRVFAELYRKTEQLEALNRELESRVADRTRALESSNTRLLLSEQARSIALAAGHMGSWEYDVTSGEWRVDEGQCRIFGVDRAQVASPGLVGTLIHPDDWSSLIRARDRVTPAQSTFQSEIRIVRPNGEVRWCLVSAAATFLDQTMQRISGVTIDITERKEAEQKQALLAREVDHRARNALAVVQAIVRLSRAKDIDEYVSNVDGRIRALALSHDLLSRSRWEGADMEGLIREEVAPFRADNPRRIRIEGPPILLAPDKAQTVALALHELATNAAKYGGLSTPEGGVDIRWTVTDGMIEIDWRELGGPPVSKPTMRGFGTRIIEASINPRRGEYAVFKWHPDGLSCTVAISRGGDDSRSQQDADISASRSVGRPLLIVEDEPLTGLLTRELLDQMGYAVVGPMLNLQDALQAAQKAQIDGAVLDINLGGDLAFPLAKILTDRQIPFVFLTGYDRSAIDRNFGDLPVLQKPVTANEFATAIRTMLNESAD
jgi:PAS domain S-box-containing protein